MFKESSTKGDSSKKRTVKSDFKIHTWFPFFWGGGASGTLVMEQSPFYLNKDYEKQRACLKPYVLLARKDSNPIIILFRSKPNTFALTSYTSTRTSVPRR